MHSLDPASPSSGSCGYGATFPHSSREGKAVLLGGATPALSLCPGAPSGHRAPSSPAVFSLHCAELRDPRLGLGISPSLQWLLQGSAKCLAERCSTAGSAVGKEGGEASILCPELEGGFGNIFKIYFSS